MAKRKQIRLKMKGSLHGHPIAVPRNMEPRQAASHLLDAVQQDTPRKSGKHANGWKIVELSSGDIRVQNDEPAIRRLMIDGHSKQAGKGAYNGSIKRARSGMLQEALNK